MTTATTAPPLLTSEMLLQHWQGHRRLTRKTIEAFPEDQLFTYAVGGMRSFGELACEFLGMVIPTADGLATGKWERFAAPKPTSKSEVLRIWDEQTAQLNEKFPTIPPGRFSEVDKIFGQWEMTGLAAIQYVIENEIHHRGQGYVYLRALGVEPPAFWDR